MHVWPKVGAQSGAGRNALLYGFWVSYVFVSNGIEARHMRSAVFLVVSALPPERDSIRHSTRSSAWEQAERVDVHRK